GGQRLRGGGRHARFREVDERSQVDGQAANRRLRDGAFPHHRTALGHSMSWSLPPGPGRSQVHKVDSRAHRPRPKRGSDQPSRTRAANLTASTSTSKRSRPSISTTGTRMPYSSSSPSSPP